MYQQSWTTLLQLYIFLSQSFVISLRSFSILRSAFTTSIHIFLVFPFLQDPSSVSNQHFFKQLFLSVCITCINQSSILSYKLFDSSGAQFFSKQICTSFLMHTGIARSLEHACSIYFHLLTSLPHSEPSHYRLALQFVHKYHAVCLTQKHFAINKSIRSLNFLHSFLYLDSILSEYPLPFLIRSPK